MTHACPTSVACGGCGILLSDGYCVDCHRCRGRRRGRLRREEVFSPTGFPGEAIDNRTPEGRIVPFAFSGRRQSVGGTPEVV